MSNSNSNESVVLHYFNILYAPYQGDPITDFPTFKEIDDKRDFRDDVPLDYFGIFLFLFILQSVIFGVIGYGLYIGYFDEKFFSSKLKIPFFSHLYQEIEQEYEKPQQPTMDQTME